MREGSKKNYYFCNNDSLQTTASAKRIVQCTIKRTKNQ